MRVFWPPPLSQAHVHGLSAKQMTRLAEFEAAMKKEEQVVSERAPSPDSSSMLDHTIPSVPTLDQLPYLNIESVSILDAYMPRKVLITMLLHYIADLYQRNFIALLPVYVVTEALCVHNVCE